LNKPNQSPNMKIITNRNISNKKKHQKSETSPRWSIEP